MFKAMEENTGKNWRLASPTGFAQHYNNFAISLTGLVLNPRGSGGCNFRPLNTFDFGVETCSLLTKDAPPSPAPDGPATHPSTSTPPRHEPPDLSAENSQIIEKERLMGQRNVIQKPDAKQRDEAQEVAGIASSTPALQNQCPGTAAGGGLIGLPAVAIAEKKAALKQEDEGHQRRSASAHKAWRTIRAKKAAALQAPLKTEGPFVAGSPGSAMQRPGMANETKPPSDCRETICEILQGAPKTFKELYNLFAERQPDYSPFRQEVNTGKMASLYAFQHHLQQVAVLRNGMWCLKEEMRPELSAASIDDTAQSDKKPSSELDGKMAITPAKAIQSAVAVDEACRAAVQAMAGSPGNRPSIKQDNATEAAAQRERRLAGAQRPWIKTRAQRVAATQAATEAVQLENASELLKHNHSSDAVVECHPVRIERRKRIHAHSRTAWRHCDVFPVIANVIEQLFRQHRQFITAREISANLLLNSEGRTFVAAALEARTQQKSRESEASNMVNWFSAQITRNKTEWARAFERTRIDGRWAYKPIHC